MKEIPIRIYIKRLYGKGLASYLSGSYKRRAKICVDLHACLNFLTEHPDWLWTELLSECVVHEIYHMIEDILNRTFNEDEIENALMWTRTIKKAKQNEDLMEWIRNNAMPGISDDTVLIHKERLEETAQLLSPTHEK